MNNKLFDMIQYGKEYRIFFVNGYQETATILDRDDTKMLVKDQKGQKKLVYFHAVSTINL
jgi:sRNA-binding regulator protein Hfq